jgi:ParB family chromosome partitioning protein
MSTPPTATKSAPVGAISASLSQLTERGKHADDIEKQLAAGTTIVELDPELIEPSFVTDRMPIADEALADLVDAIKTNTQLSPVLVRPHPEKAGHYQSSFGHRRIRATKILGIKVKAVVRDLSDEEMVVAQGQENHARKDLSYIEKARFAERLSKRFSRDVIMQALSVYKSDLSNMLAVAHRVPEDLADIIGPAPKSGRRGWIELADHLKAPRLLELARKEAATPEFALLESDDRLKAMLSAVKTQPARAKTETWSDAGKKLAKVTSSSGKITLTIDRKASPEFADFVLTRLKTLYVSEKKSGGEGT